MRPFQFHIAAMAVFASIIAPFGGFFASGFKRAFKIKDFGDMIPGHGGLMGKINFKILKYKFSECDFYFSRLGCFMVKKSQVALMNFNPRTTGLEIHRRNY